MPLKGQNPVFMVYLLHIEVICVPESHRVQLIPLTARQGTGILEYLI
jgi:hypothetical protein